MVPIRPQRFQQAAGKAVEMWIVELSQIALKS
jgi:hypothetical protein